MELIDAIYEGNLEEVKKFASDIKNTGVYTIDHIMHGMAGEQYRIGLIPLILKSEADHPGHFFKYKALLDYVATVKGIDSVLFSWKSPYFSKYTDMTKSKHVDVPISDQMHAYLHRLEVHHTKHRKDVNSVLHGIDSMTKSTASETTESKAQKRPLEIQDAARKAKLAVAALYRLKYPKSAE